VIDIRGGMKVRPIDRPLRPSPGDVILQLGWNDSPQGILKAKRKLGFRYISLIHDLIPVRAPHFVPREFPAEVTDTMLERIAASDLLLANSKYTRDDLLGFARQEAIDLRRMEVLRLGSEVTRTDTDAAPPPGIPSLESGASFVL